MRDPAEELVHAILEVRPPKEHDPRAFAPAVWGNRKVPRDTAIVGELPSGWSCPYAKQCKTYWDPVKRKVIKGPESEFRCYSASLEAAWPSVANKVRHNREVLRGKSTKQMADVIMRSVPWNAKRVRIHESGDFFSQAYFDAWLRVAQENDNIVFYAYTKSLPFWIKRLNEIPPNFKLTASRGGKADDLIEKYGLKEARVVKSHEEAEALGLEVDEDDSHAWASDDSFALLIHGTQDPGSEYAKAVSALRRMNKAKGGKGRTLADLRNEAKEKDQPGKDELVFDDEGNGEFIFHF